MVAHQPFGHGVDMCSVQFSLQASSHGRRPANIYVAEQFKVAKAVVSRRHVAAIRSMEKWGRQGTKLTIVPCLGSMSLCKCLLVLPVTRFWLLKGMAGSQHQRADSRNKGELKLHPCQDLPLCVQPKYIMQNTPDFTARNNNMTLECFLVVLLLS